MAESMDSLWKKYDNGDGTYLYELPNGLRIVFTPTAKSGIVYCGFLIGTGSRYESEKDNGMAHF
ncbi:MAG: insulinase family protein, partial [Sphingobacteriales bacterium]|nr:insulinase family protein [Sphingobacteriales bacterium]